MYKMEKQAQNARQFSFCNNNCVACCESSSKHITIVLHNRIWPRRQEGGHDGHCGEHHWIDDAYFVRRGEISLGEEDEVNVFAPSKKDMILTFYSSNGRTRHLILRIKLANLYAYSSTC